MRVNFVSNGQGFFSFDFYVKFSKNKSWRSSASSKKEKYFCKCISFLGTELKTRMHNYLIITWMSKHFSVIYTDFSCFCAYTHKLFCNKNNTEKRVIVICTYIYLLFIFLLLYTSTNIEVVQSSYKRFIFKIY